MIQRIQSVFFLLTGAFFGGEFATSFASSSQSASGIFNDQVFNLYDHIGLQIMAVLGIVLSIVAIFLFKNRGRQIKIGYLLTTLSILLPVAAILIFTGQSDQIEVTDINDSLGLYLPLGMIISSMLAVRFIKKDEQLVQSMDRLR